MVTENPENKTLEFENPGSLLVLVILFILYSLGFIDLLAHTSAARDVFGLYSLPFFLFLILYAGGLVVLGILFFHSKSLERVKQMIAFLQSRNWLGLAFLLGLSAGILIIFADWDRWLGFPVLRLMSLLIIVLLTVIVVFSGWRRSGSPELWRRAAALVLAVALLLELLFQGLAWAGLLPGFLGTIDSPFISFGRVYNPEGIVKNTTRNRDGLYYPDPRFDESSTRFLLTGDAAIEALEINPADHMGVRLEQLITADAGAGPGTEVFALGMPGYTPAIYLDLPLLPFTLDYYNPEEIIVFIDVGRDFDTLANPAPGIPRYVVDDAGGVQLDPDSRFDVHTLQHTVLHAYEPVQPVLAIQSHYLTLRLLGALFSADTARVAAADSTGSSGPLAPGERNMAFFLAEGNPQATRGYTIALELLDKFQSYAEGRGHTVRLVTIPAFPSEFFTAYQGDAWEGVIGSYDLFLPERKLIEFAASKDLPILPMGHYMKSQGLTVDQIREMFFSVDAGHLTPEGHAYFASAIFDCFYSKTRSSEAGQDSVVCTGE